MLALWMEQAPEQWGNKVTVYVLCKIDMHDRSEILGVFACVEVAKTIAEAEEPGKRYDWNDDGPNVWYVLDFGSEGPVYQYNIETFEVREK